MFNEGMGMKKFYLILISILLVFLTSCCYEIEKNDLYDYKQYISESGIGYSDVELDHPDYFLPSRTFLTDYEYLTGNFYYYENSPFCDTDEHKYKPDRSFISLTYNKETYCLAKANVLKNIAVYNEKYYHYNDYQFYINKNFMDSIDTQDSTKMPSWFTMVCYNDTNNTIIFLGFSQSYPKLDDKYLYNIDNNWGDFIKQYYGDLYNFDV